MSGRDGGDRPAGRHYAAGAPPPGDGAPPPGAPDGAEPSLPRQLVLLLLKVAMVLGFARWCSCSCSA